MFGSVLGGIAGGIIGGSDLGGMASLIPVGSILADELIKLLDCKEQKQAANATNEAIRGGVGTEVRWQSETRAERFRRFQGDRPAATCRWDQLHDRHGRGDHRRRRNNGPEADVSRKGRQRLPEGVT